MMNCQHLSPSQVAQLSNVVLIDVRSPAEYHECHAQGAILVPLEEITPERIRPHVTNGAQLALLCKSGMRAQRAAEKLADAFATIVVSGGTDAWVSAGLPFQRHAHHMPLQQQLFITVGTLVLSSVVLGTWVAPAWYALAGTIGAGLMFAGITGNCYLSLLLARMPWNRALNT
jgi:rhodanese-related sulfurtransferase